MALCQKSEIGLEIERSDTSSDRVCHACVRKIRKAFELHNFIYWNLQKVKQAAIEVLKQQKDIKHQAAIPLLRSSAILFQKIWSSMITAK